MKALVLEGGGGRGAYQAGAVKALRKKVKGLRKVSLWIQS